MSLAPLYELENIEQRYSGRLALEIEKLAVAEGSITGLAGHNGSGKSTLLRMLAFLERPAAGVIRFHGRPVSWDKSLVQLRQEVTLLTQEPYLLKRSVYANLAYGLKLRGKIDDGLIREGLAMVGLDPDSFGPRSWHELSGGEAQRVALAQRLVLRPKVLLLDEPTASLDEESAQMVLQASLLAKKEWSATLVVISHDREWLEAVSDSVVVLKKGHLIGEAV